ncbi:uncharacterized protein LOC144119321 [Amblyomma americanum]
MSSEGSICGGESCPHNCEVVLFAPPLGNGSAAAVDWFLTRVAGFVPSRSGWAWYRHWGVAFIYSDGNALYCNAGCDLSTGELVGNWTWLTTEDQDAMAANQMPLGKHCIPESKVAAAIQDLRGLGQYHVTRNNCQKWVTKLLKKLGIIIPPC